MPEKRPALISPPGLHRGSRVAVLSPASAAREESVLAGISALRLFGYEPILMPNALRHGPLHYAGTAEERASDLQAAFADPGIEAVICTRGGWGSAELLPLLDATLMRANPKPFIGYSDHTSLHTWLWNECGGRSVYGPMVAADWSLPEGVHEPSWRAVLEAEGQWQAGAADGLVVLQEGDAEGRLLGGCLSILEASLGTPWAFRAEEPTILFLEDIHVKPYQWDRMLQHLRFAGAMETVRGVIFGNMDACVDPQGATLLEAACLHGLRSFCGPVLTGLRCGHVQGGNRSLPLGAWVAIRGNTVS